MGLQRRRRWAFGDVDGREDDDDLCLGIDTDANRDAVEATHQVATLGQLVIPAVLLEDALNIGDGYHVRPPDDGSGELTSAVVVTPGIWPKPGMPKPPSDNTGIAGVPGMGSGASREGGISGDSKTPFWGRVFFQ